MKNVNHVLVGFLLVLMLGCSSGKGPSSWSRFWAAVRVRLTSGKAELQKALDAKKNVKSFRMRIDLTMHPGSALVTEIEVACPDRERITSSIGEKSFQSVRVGADGYIQTKDGQWVKQTVTPASYPCGTNPGDPSPWAMINEGRDMAVVIANMAGSGKSPITIAPASLSQAEGEVCQPWVISFDHPGGQSSAHGARGMTYTLCLDTHDHLPRKLLLGNGGMTVIYSDWNKPMQIEVPAEAKMSTEVAKAH